MSFTVRDLVDLGHIHTVAPSPDGRWLAVEVQQLDAEGARFVSAIWRLEADGSGARPLLSGLCAYASPTFRHDGALLVRSNRPLEGEPTEAPAREARFQVWVLHEGHDTPAPLTDEPLGVSELRAAPHGDRFVVIAPVHPGVPHQEQRTYADDRRKHGPSALHYTAGPVRHWDHWIAPAAPHVIAYRGDGSGRRDLTPGADREHREADWDLSEDGRFVVIMAARPNDLRLDDHQLLVLDTASGAATVAFEEARVSCNHPRFSPDGASIAFAAVRWQEHTPLRTRLFTITREGADLCQLAEAWDRWPTPAGFTADGAKVVVITDDEGHHRAFTVHRATHAVERLVHTDGTIATLVRAPSGFVGIHHGLFQAPRVIQVPAEGGAPTVVHPLMETPAFDGVLESFTVPGAHGDVVQSWLALPRGASGPLPTLVWIHGGPMSAWNDQWHRRWNVQVMLDAGYAVVLPNPRGSTGFGQALIDGIWGNQYGAACFTDVMAVTDAAAADPRIDADRMVAMGGSFGGYMVNWIGGQTDRFRALVTHASLYDLPRFYGVTDHPPFWLLKMGTDPWKDPEGFVKYSPHTRIPQWRSPTLVIHGERDYRVPVGEGIALFEALQLHGVDSELLVFPDENHWIGAPRNVIAWYDHVLDFLARHLSDG